MTLIEPTVSFQERIGKQFEIVSRLSETLALRVIELEERINELERNRSTYLANDQKTKEMLLKSEEQLQNLYEALEIDNKKDKCLLDSNKVSSVNGLEDQVDINPGSVTNISIVDESEEDINDQRKDTLNSLDVLETEYIDYPPDSMMTA